MPRYLTLVIEGIVLGLVFGFAISFVTLQLGITLIYSAIGGIIVRFVFDYVWGLYNRMNGN